MGFRSFAGKLVYIFAEEVEGCVYNRRSLAVKLVGDALAPIEPNYLFRCCGEGEKAGEKGDENA